MGDRHLVDERNISTNKLLSLLQHLINHTNIVLGKYLSTKILGLSHVDQRLSCQMPFDQVVFDQEMCSPFKEQEGHCLYLCFSLWLIPVKLTIKGSTPFGRKPLGQKTFG